MEDLTTFNFISPILGKLNKLQRMLLIILYTSTWSALFFIAVDAVLLSMKNLFCQYCHSVFACGCSIVSASESFTVDRSTKTLTEREHQVFNVFMRPFWRINTFIFFVPCLIYVYSPIQDVLTDWYVINKIITVISFKLQHFYFLTSYTH